MKFVFDHVVHYAENPLEAIPLLAEKGIHAVEGGAHRNRPTYNVLSYFDLSYIELIGTTDKAALKQMEHPKHSMIKTIIDSDFTEGFARFVVRTENIEAAAEHFRSKGLTVNGPVYLSRERPDGSLLEWRLLFVGTDDEDLQMPFIIQWNESDEERKQDLTERGVIATHSAGVTFSHLSIAVRDLDETIQRWSELLHLETGERYIDEQLQAECQPLLLEGGNLMFCSPIGDGFVTDFLNKHGEKPFRLHFSNGKTAETFNVCGGIYQIDRL